MEVLLLLVSKAKLFSLVRTAASSPSARACRRATSTGHSECAAPTSKKVERFDVNLDAISNVWSQGVAYYLFKIENVPAVVGIDSDLGDSPLSEQLLESTEADRCYARALL